VATEDKNFFKHGGVDLVRTVSAVLSDVRTKRYAQGGSTVTQQLARGIFLSPRKTLSRKLNEYFITFEIERRTPRTRSSRCTATRSTWATATTASRRRRATTSERA
jgi:membrane peptidoglycan carboxypeptidase